MTHFRSSAASLLGAALLALIFAACDGTGTNADLDVNDPPEVVPPEAFELGTDLFSDSNADAQNATKVGTGEHAHFANAAFRAWPVSFALKVNLAVPAAVTAAALQANPVVEDGTWIWEATVDTTDHDHEMTFRLEGTPDGETIFWRMNVTVPEPPLGEPLEDFELYTAETTLDGSSGTWTLYYPIEGEQTAVLNAEFTVTDDHAKEITFRVPDYGGEFAGQSVYYAVDGSTRTFEWTRIEEGVEKVVTVVWDAETKAGFIVAPGYNGGEKACWDADLVNTECVA
mgnify:CR=1 FL=1